ncbi:phosphate ABC transporter permease subunit PstC [Aciduricibacillus chroicocephali]|uniref:Phosphate transport system permease protein n=1 Tax=Aciduricibacillus chroicocephali TaxID=3054939 RepID=A0ABY9KSP0_9BACI|nr:phosphate ABC transporter permease subunit PstC [Bacillaceae bacterium 44XB]
MEAAQSTAKTRLLKKQRRLGSEFRGRLLVMTAAIIIIISTLSITAFLTAKGIQTFINGDVGLSEFLTSSQWNPTAENPQYGALPFIVGSLSVTLLSALIAGPLGIAGAIFMIEIAPSWGRKVLQPVIELLVGIPSVVYGFIALTVVVPFIRNTVGGTGYSMLAGVIVLSVMILPTITSIATDAIKSQPDELRDGAYALGATRWQMIRKVVVPAAKPALFTAIILGMARAFGEALAVQMVIGNVRDMPGGVLDPSATLTSIITLNMGHTTYGSVENNTLWSMGLVLLAISFLFILIIRYLSARRNA